MTRKKRPLILRLFLWLVSALVVLACFPVTGVLLLIQVEPGESPEVSAQTEDQAILELYDGHIADSLRDARDGALSVKKVFWLNEEEMIAPEPDTGSFGSTTDPSELQWLLDQAAETLGIEDFVFGTDVTIRSGSRVRYYLDETIFAISWQEIRHGCVYTLAEVKIAHPSQFRRYLAGGEYGSNDWKVTTDMASYVNAVVASSGDFYDFRNLGVSVYEGKVQRLGSKTVDTCFITADGDMIFAKRGEITDIEQAQQFVDEHEIRFSLAFGPALVENGVRCDPETYSMGEINDRYPRAALCQMGELHYLLATANNGYGYSNMPRTRDFAAELEKLGCWMAYSLDGGQTGVLVMEDRMINPLQYDNLRMISDIIYFATAVPDGT